jgi:hypothetical protein
MPSSKLKPPTQQKAKLVIFPGEVTFTVTRHDRNGKLVKRTEARGSIYVVNGGGEVYTMAGGPPPGQGYNDVGGHTAESTPAGNYVLDREEQVVTSSWPNSVIPWGADLRETNPGNGIIEVQYAVGSQWRTATGRYGTVSQANWQFLLRSGKRVTFDKADAEVREWFYRPNGSLFSKWIRNDFGPSGWCLKDHGERTSFYIHTTPEEEWEAGTNKPVILTGSHGCIHITPSDRDEMVKKHYLDKGVEVEVRKYGVMGPP